MPPPPPPTKKLSSTISSRWSDLAPEVLSTIFTRMSADEMVRVIPMVCKWWRDVVAGPYCWVDIDIESWCRRRDDTHAVDLVVRKLVRRSRRTFRRLSAYKVGEAGFAFTASCGKCLTILQIPVSEITDQMVLKHVDSLPNLTVLDISCCSNISWRGLEAFGKACKSLVHLKRNMPPKKFGTVMGDDREAMVISDTMKGLNHLDLCFGLFSDNGLSAILGKCLGLSHLNIQGCHYVKLEGDLEVQCESLVYFQSPWVDEFDDLLDGEDGSFNGEEASSEETD